MKEAIFVDLGGTLMLPEPRISDYLKQADLKHAETSVKWRYAINGLRSGTIRPRILDGVQYAVDRLAEKYALSCFADGPDEFIRLCLEEMPSISGKFPSDLVIPNSALETGGKRSLMSWEHARRYLDARGYVPAAVVDDDIRAIEASALAGLRIPRYLIDNESETPRKKLREVTDYIAVRGLAEMADNFLGPKE